MTRMMPQDSLGRSASSSMSVQGPSPGWKIHWIPRAILGSMRHRTSVAVLIGAAAIVCIVGCRREGTGVSTAPERILVLGFDGLDPAVVDTLMGEGKLPSFARLRREGAYGPLLSSKPLLSPVIWTTIATGKRPDQHHIGHFVAVSGATGEPLPVTSRMRRVKAVWNILSEAGRSVSVLGWWATWPAETVKGAIVSDHLCYHFLMEDGPARDQDMTGVTYPAGLVDRLSPLIVRLDQLTSEDLARFVTVEPNLLKRPFDFNDDLSHFKWALASCETYRRIGLRLWKEDRPDLMMVYFEGTDSTSHLFGHLFRSGPLAGELAVQQMRFGNAVERMYMYADEVLGDFVAQMDDRTTMMVLSDHGFQLGRLPDDPSQTRDMRRVSERYHNLYGILYLYGSHVKHGVRLRDPKLLDILPTVLALSGVPAARDMGGRVLTEALDVAVPARVPTYETSGIVRMAAQNGAVSTAVEDGGVGATAKDGGVRAAGQDGGVGGAAQDRGKTGPEEAAETAGSSDARDAKVDPQILERLRSLGYVGDGSLASDPNTANTSPGDRNSANTSPTGDRNPADGPPAGSHNMANSSPAGDRNETGRFSDRRVVDSSPTGDRNLAAILFDSGRYAESEAAYRKLLEKSPRNAGLHSSLSGVLGAENRSAEAMREIEIAIRIDPLLPEPYHNRAVIHERQGNVAAAIEDYRTALRYAPWHEPSVQALSRLGVSSNTWRPSSEAEKRALALANEASQDARRGDYKEAMAKLDQAERLAPRSSLILQYRSNVAYLMGDRAAAIAALEKGLRIEPGNALFRKNLESLRRSSPGKRETR